MEDTVTSDFAQFGSRERGMVQELLLAWDDSGLPVDFDDNEVTIMLNTRSGHVFLTNSEFQAAMMNGGKLESFYTCPNCGHEGFAENMTVFANEDKEYNSHWIIKCPECEETIRE